MRIAETACATIFATRKFESAKRIEVLNKAREEVGDYDGPYPLSDDYLWTSLTLGGKQSCIDKIIKPPPPPPKTKAELEAEAAAAEARAKRAEEERIAKEKAEAEAKRKAEEKAKYIAENTKTTYLVCPLAKDKRNWLNESGSLLFKLNKVDDEYLESIAMWLHSLEDDDYSSCSWAGDKREPCERVQHENGETAAVFWSGEKVSAVPLESIFDYDDDSTSYGNKILNISGYLLDRVTLTAATSRSRLGDTYYNNYQCQISSKEIYDQEILKASNRVKIAADAYKANLKEKQSEETQI